MKAILLVLVGCSLLLAGFSKDYTHDIVTDSTTGLMWQDNEVESSTNWQGAIDRCESLVLGGHSDWRLPNKNELVSIVDYSRQLPDPRLNEKFENTVLAKYWSSTTLVSDTNQAWNVDFFATVTDYYPKSNSHYVRCVRGGN